jgi:hypothetical protein
MEASKPTNPKEANTLPSTFKAIGQLQQRNGLQQDCFDTHPQILKAKFYHNL